MINDYIENPLAQYTDTEIFRAASLDEADVEWISNELNRLMQPYT